MVMWLLTWIWFALTVQYMGSIVYTCIYSPDFFSFFTLEGFGQGSKLFLLHMPAPNMDFFSWSTVGIIMVEGSTLAIPYIVTWTAMVWWPHPVVQQSSPVDWAWRSYPWSQGHPRGHWELAGTCCAADTAPFDVDLYEKDQQTAKSCDIVVAVRR